MHGIQCRLFQCLDPGKFFRSAVILHGIGDCLAGAEFYIGNTAAHGGNGLFFQQGLFKTETVLEVIFADQQRGKVFIGAAHPLGGFISHIIVMQFAIFVEVGRKPVRITIGKTEVDVMAVCIDLVFGHRLDRRNPCRPEGQPLQITDLCRSIGDLVGHIQRIGIRLERKCFFHFEIRQITGKHHTVAVFHNMETARLCGKHIARIEGTFCFALRFQDQIFAFCAVHILSELLEFSGDQRSGSRIKGELDQIVFQRYRSGDSRHNRYFLFHRSNFFINRFHDRFRFCNCQLFHDCRSSSDSFRRFLLLDRNLIFQLLLLLQPELLLLLLLILRIQEKPARHDQSGNHQHHDRFFIKFHFFFSFICFGGTGS